MSENSGAGRDSLRAENIVLHYAALLESSDDAIIVKTLDGKITNWNPGAEKIFGYTAEEVIGKPMLILFPPDRVDEEDLILKKISRGERVNNFETVRLRKDKQPVHVSLSIVPIRDAAGNVVGASKIASDLTEQKRAEERIQKAEDRYRATLDQLLEGCQIVDFEYRYVYVNDAAATQGKRSKEELLGHTMVEMFPGVEKTRMFTELRRCMESRVAHRMENEFAYPDGSTGWFNLSMQPVPEGVFVLALDITQQKELLDKLSKHSDRLEQLVGELLHHTT